MGLKELTQSVYSRLIDVYHTITSDSSGPVDDYEPTLTDIFNKLGKAVPKVADKVADSLERAIGTHAPFAQYLSTRIRPVSDFIDKGDKYFLENVNPRVEQHLKMLNRKYKPHLKAIKKAIQRLYISL